jgi:hypothetical protein
MPRIVPTCVMIVIFLSFLSAQIGIRCFSILSQFTTQSFGDVSLNHQISNKESVSHNETGKNDTKLTPDTQRMEYHSGILNTTTGLSNATVKQRRRRHSQMMIKTTTMIEICRSCQRTKIEATNRTCEMELRHRMKSLPNEWPFWLQTMLQLAAKHDACRRECHPSYPTIECKNSMIKTVNHGLGFDDLAPILHHAVSPILSTFQEAIDENITNGYSLFVYNPTILPFSSDTYLAFFRVSTELHVPIAAYRNYVIAAILDKSFQVLSNVFLDINQHLNLIRRRGGYEDYTHGFTDFRVFLVNGTYLLSDKLRVLPLRFILEKNHDLFSNMTFNESLAIYEFEISPIFGTGLKVIRIGKLRNIQNLKFGKNFQFIEVESGKEVFVEEWPLPLGKGEDDGRRVSRLEFQPTVAESRRYNATLQPLGLYSPEPPLVGDELQFQKDMDQWRYSEDRGTVCCIRLEREYYADLTLNTSILSHPHLILGISHIQSLNILNWNATSRKKRGYLSRFYSLLPTVPPIDVASQSPLFCWPYMSSPEHTLSGGDELLLWKNRAYACPEITFPSGMTVSLSNSSRIIVAYGINDRMPVLAEINKRDVALRLFSPIPYV